MDDAFEHALCAQVEEWGFCILFNNSRESFYSSKNTNQSWRYISTFLSPNALEKGNECRVRKKRLMKSAMCYIYMDEWIASSHKSWCRQLHCCYLGPLLNGVYTLWSDERTSNSFQHTHTRTHKIKGNEKCPGKKVRLTWIIKWVNNYFKLFSVRAAHDDEKVYLHRVLLNRKRKKILFFHCIVQKK